jgi:hypothetical protein
VSRDVRCLLEVIRCGKFRSWFNVPIAISPFSRLLFSTYTYMYRSARFAENGNYTCCNTITTEILEISQ